MKLDLRTPHRARPTLAQYLSLYWLATDENMDDGWTSAGWFRRNPFYNFLSTVAGIAHLPRITASTDAHGDTFPRAGGMVCAVALTFRCRGTVPVALPWVAWRGLGVECGAGWKMNGTLSVTMRRQGAKNATEVNPS